VAGRPLKDRKFEEHIRPNSPSPKGNVGDDDREHRGPPIRRDEEQSSRDEAGEREEDQRLPPANTIRDEADDEGVEPAAEHGRGQDDSDCNFGETELVQVDAEDDSEEAVGDRSDRLLKEDEPPVSIDPVSETRRSTPLRW